MNKILAWLVGAILLLGVATPACGFWADEEMKKDVRPYAVISAHVKNIDLHYPDYIITDIWLDNSGYIIFVDMDNDGKDDFAHVHRVVFYLEDGTPIFICEGNVPPDEARAAIEEFIRLHSI